MDQMSFAILYLLACQPLILVILLMTIMAENDHIVVYVVGPIAIYMMDRKYLNSSNPTDRTGIVRLTI